MKESEFVLKTDTIRKLPLVLNSKSLSNVVSSLNNRYSPLSGYPVSPPITRPSIQIRSDRGKLQIRYQGHNLTVAQGEAKSLKLEQPGERTSNGRQVNPTVYFDIENYGKLDVHTNNIVQENQ